VAWAGASELFVAAVSALILLLCIRPSRDSSVVNVHELVYASYTRDVMICNDDETHV